MFQKRNFDLLMPEWVFNVIAREARDRGLSPEAFTIHFLRQLAMDLENKRLTKEDRALNLRKTAQSLQQILENTHEN